MHPYVILIRGVNVGGKNLLPMADLRTCLESQGYSQVSTYIASGNILLRSDQPASAVKTHLEGLLPQKFALDDAFIKVLVLTPAQLQAVVSGKPQGFGEQPETYHSDVIFLMGLDAEQTMAVFNPREGVDQIWPGDGVIYSQRLSAMRTKSRLNKIMSAPAYKSMTIRTWNTVKKLLEMVNSAQANPGAVK
jgi:uncharacterized protein (DUF1697 family)